MPKGRNQKLKLFFLRKILTERTDREHGITIKNILEILDENDIGAERKSLYDDMKELEKTGVIIKGQKKGNEYYYHVDKREFELAELKLLVDAIQSSRFITEKKSDELIRKLEGFCSVYEAGDLQRQVYVSGRVKTMNESIYNSIDAIYNSISSNHEIRFKYGSWNIKKEMELKKGGAFYQISPWALVWSNEYYYMIGFDSEAAMIKHYRVDKMSAMSYTDTLRKGSELFKNFNLAEYTQKNMSMYEGVEKTISLEADNSLVGVFIDKFGLEDVTVMSSDESKSIIRFRVCVNSQFLGWIFALNGKARIIGPESVVQQAEDMIKKLYLQYCTIVK